MQAIKVFIDKEIIRVNNDREIAHQFSPFFLKKLSEKEILDDDELAKFGLDIFNNIFSPEKREWIRKKLDSVPKGQTLVISISSESEDIHNIPFEIINEDGTERGFLLKRGNVSLVRNIPGVDKRTTPIVPPIKILIILSLPIEIYQQGPPIDLLKELDVVYSALRDYIEEGFVLVDVEERADRNTIRERVLHEGYDIVHFTGHGEAGGYLIVEDEKDYRHGKRIDAQEIKEIFEGSNVRLFYFDSCETARSTDFEPSLALHVFDALPSAYVIANSLRVKDELATAITKHIYEEIFRGRTPDALNVARLKVKEDWWKPILFCEPDREIFRIDTKKGRKKKRIRVVSRPPQPPGKYVYRYDVVREATARIEKQNYLVLHGIGGAGKSTMAGYLSRFYDAKFRHILFIDLKEKGITTPEGLLEEILKLTRREGLLDGDTHLDILEKTKNLDSEERALRLWDFAKEILLGKKSFQREKSHPPKNTLLLLDNMEETVQDFDGIIKAEWKDFISSLLQENGLFTIFTTRLKPYLTRRNGLENVLEIGEYTPSEIRFLSRDLDSDGRAYLFRYYLEIEKSFGHHPLVISRAIEERRDNVQTLLNLTDLKELFEFYRPYFKRYEKDAERFFSLAYPFSARFMEEIFTSDFVSLIRNRLLLLKESRGSFLPYNIIHSYFKNDFKLDMEGLKIFKIDIVKAYENGKFEEVDLLNALSALTDYYLRSRDKDLEEKIATIFCRIEMSNSVAQLRQEDLEKFENVFKKFSAPKQAEATILNNLGAWHGENGRWKEAEESFEKALVIYKKLTKTNPSFLPDIAGTLANLGNTYRCTGRQKKAEEFLKESLRIQKEVAKTNPAYWSKVAVVLNNLGVVYSDAGKLKETEDCYLEALQIRRKLAEIDPVYRFDVAETYGNLGVFYREIGKQKEAEGYWTAALNGFYKLSEDSPAYLPGLANAQNNLGILCGETGRHREAEHCYGKALEIYRNLAQTNEAYWPKLALTQINSGNLYCWTGKHREAENSYREALRILRDLAETNPVYWDNVAGNLNNLGNLYSWTGRQKEAEKSFSEALEIFKQLSKTNPVYWVDTAKNLNCLGGLYFETGRQKEAEDSYNEALRICRELPVTSPSYRPNIAMTLYNLGFLYHMTGRQREAETSWNEALEMYGALVKTNSAHLPEFARTLFNLGALYCETGRKKEAEDCCEQALEIFKQMEDHEKQLGIYPALIDSMVRPEGIDYQTLADHICNFLDLFDAFHEKHKTWAMDIVSFFVDQKTFKKVDVGELKRNIKYPICKERLSGLMELIDLYTADPPPVNSSSTDTQPALLVEELIETQVDCFCKYMKEYPDRDKHAWLAMTLKSRYPDLDERSSYAATWLFSALSIKDAPAALGFYLIDKEMPQSADPYLNKFLSMMVPIWKLLDEKKFISTWKSENPWTFKNEPWLMDIIKQGEELGIRGLVQLGTMGQ